MTAPLRRQGTAPPRKVHYRRVIRGTRDAWVHCGRPLATVQATRRLQDVTCRVCLGYIAKGLAYGYAPPREEETLS